MKTCPICGARLFEDMDTCYGCMHRFDGKKADKAVGELELSGCSSEQVGDAPEEPPDLLADNLLRGSREKAGAHTWNARFELVNQAQQNYQPLTCVLTVELLPAESSGGSARSSPVLKGAEPPVEVVSK